MDSTTGLRKEVLLCLHAPKDMDLLTFIIISKLRGAKAPRQMIGLVPTIVVVRIAEPLLFIPIKDLHNCHGFLTCLLSRQAAIAEAYVCYWQ